MTNGEKILQTFPHCKTDTHGIITKFIIDGYNYEFSTSWWDAEYKEPTPKENLVVEDCISRAEAIRVASGYCHPSNVAKELANLPSVTPQEPRKGHWIDEGIYADGQSYHSFMCSECGWHHIEHKNELVDFKYCPFCRADMREVEET